MAINLARNTKVYFTTNVDPSTGALASTTMTAANTWEINVLDGYSFSQSSASQNISMNEAGPTPTRGQRTFNSALNPADFTFSTYMRPFKTGTGDTAVVQSNEYFLWNALVHSANLTHTAITTQAVIAATAVPTLASATITVPVTAGHGVSVGSPATVFGIDLADWNGIGIVSATTATSISIALQIAPTSAGPATGFALVKVAVGAWTSIPGGTAGMGVGTAPRAIVNTSASNIHQLQKFAIIFKVDNAYYVVENSALDSATVDFGIDAIATVAWVGKGTKLTSPATLVIAAVAPTASAHYITNKLSTATLKQNFGINTAGTQYTVAITGGSIQFSNNLTYLTPSTLGIVDSPIGYFTGTRTVTGNLTAYLRSGTAGDVATLINDLLALAATAEETQHALSIELGGITNSTRVDFDLSAVTVEIPTTNIQDVVSADIKFSAQGFNSNLTAATYDISGTNEAQIIYYSA